MPVSFESFGIKFLYPDNWKEIERPDDEGNDGVTLEMPSGGFFTVERAREGELAQEVIEEVADSFANDYGDVERELIQTSGALEDEIGVEFRFYYLDLLILSRLIVLQRDGATLVIQMQAESRDFDQNEPVFSALLQQIRGRV